MRLDPRPELDPEIRPGLQPGRWSRLAALPVRGLDWLLRRLVR